MTRPPHHSPDAVVVGAGIAGLAVAHRAAARGLRTLVLDRGAPGGGTTHVAAGMLAPVSEAAFGEEALLRLNLAAAARYPGWIAELGEAGGPDPGYRRCGTLHRTQVPVRRPRMQRPAAHQPRLALQSHVGTVRQRIDVPII